MAAKGVELASAYVSLSVSTDKIPGQIKDALRGLDKGVEVDVDAKTTGASADLSRWRKEEEANRVNVKVDVDTRGASSQLSKLRKDLDFGPGFLNLNVGAAAISGLPALAAGLGNVASALQQVAQAGLAVPGGIATATASIGTLMFGLTGVSDAYTALGAASDDAATSGASQAAQARASQSASFGLRNAVVDEATARKDVARATKDAQNALQDLRIEQRGGIIDEKRSVLEAQKAREDLLRGNYTDIRDALLRVEESDQRVIEVRERNRQTTEKLTDANSKGVAGSDQVVAANERLVRSQQQIEQAQGAVAASGTKSSAAQQKAALAMSKLSPNAREFVQTMSDLANGPVGALRNMVQDNIFDGLSDQLKEVASKGAPTFEKGLGRISKAWNATFKTLGAELGSDKNLGLLDRIFGNTADTQTRLNGVIHPITEAIATLSAAGSDAMPKLADSLVGVADRFDAFITNADKDGRLDKWINEGITALGNLGETALNVGKMFTAVTNASGTSNLLGTIEQLTDKWQAFLNSDAGQTKIKAFFAEGRDIFGQWLPILQDVPDLLRGVYDAAKQWTDTFLPPLREITGFLADHKTLVEGIGAAWLASKTLEGPLKFLGTIGDISTAIRGLPKVTTTAAVGINGALGIIKIPAAVAAFLIWNTDYDKIDKAQQEHPDSLLRNPYLTGNPKPSNQGPTPPPARANDIPSGAGFPAAPGYVPTPGTAAEQLPGGPPSSSLVWPGGPVPGVAKNPLLAPYSPGGQPAAPAQGARPFLGQRSHGVSGHDQRGLPGLGMVRDAQPDDGRIGVPQHRPEPVEHRLRHVPVSRRHLGDRRRAEDLRPRDASPVRSPVHPAEVRVPVGGVGVLASPIAALVRLRGPSAPRLHAGLQRDRQAGADPDGDQAASVMSAVDPNTTVHGTGGGALPGPDELTQAALQQQQDPFANFRTEGYVPAGNTGVPGTSTLSSLFNLGNEAVAGLIDTGASAAKMAASAAITGGTMGAGAAAAPAAGLGIDTAANAAKRATAFGFQLASIGADSLIENLFSPLGGAPRWLGYDYTQFAPHLNIQQAATTTAEKAWAALHPNGGNGVDPNTTDHGTAMGALPGPGDPVNPSTMPGASTGLPSPPTDPFGTNTTNNPGAPTPGPSGPNSQQLDPNDPRNWLKPGVFDTGGVLHPNTAAINLSNQPEYVLTPQQWKAMEHNARLGGEAAGGSGSTYNVYAQDTDDAIRRLRSKEKLDAMQYGGRPW